MLMYCDLWRKESKIEQQTGLLLTTLRQIVTNLQCLGGYFLPVLLGCWIHLYSLEQVPQQMVLNQYFSGLDSSQTFSEVIFFIMIKLEMAKIIHFKM